MAGVVYMIPGYDEDIRFAGYQYVMKLFRSRGITPVGVTIRWKYRTMTDYVKGFIGQWNEGHVPAYLFGFSFGAMVALLAAPYVNIRGLYLCSLSPYFREDIRDLTPSAQRSVGKHRMNDFKKISYKEACRKVHCKTILVAGENESHAVWKRTYEASVAIRNAQFYSAPGATHDLSEEKYQLALRNVIAAAVRPAGHHLRNNNLSKILT
jgi:pimeloyl-ACP methyl ester carboxylesterase